jgi:outer membrane protein assembly factor BamB
LYDKYASAATNKPTTIAAIFMTFFIAPAFNATKNGIRNGTFTAVDLKTGKTKWVYPTAFPTWVSPLVTNGIVFAGHITEIGKPYKYDVFGTPNKTLQLNK